MKTYILDIIPKLFSFSKKLDNSTLISNKSWIVLDESSNSKIVYIFRNNGQLLLACNGLIEKGQWEYLDETTLIIDTKANSFLFKLGFFDNKVLALQLDGQEGFALLLNESFVGTEFKSSKDVESYLINTYFPPKSKVIPNIAAVNIYENEKKELILRFKKWRKKWSLTSKDISEIHSLIEHFILFDDAYFENIKSFQDKYGFDLVAEVRTIANSYALCENILAPLIKAGILEKKYPHEIRKIRSELYPENITEVCNFEKISKSDLTGIEIIGVTKLEKTITENHFILKSKITKNITIYSKKDLNNMIENGERENYFLIVS